ncbi:MAG: hypothetical protein NC434_13040 [Ruminococcus sp.]|nr:hypothetical protein [Ruminococcus sp.]
MKKNNEYTNCHDFTSDYIVEFAVEEAIRAAAGKYQEERKGPRQYWEELSRLGRMRLFRQTGCATLSVPGLVLFCAMDDTLQHSMIVYDTNAWAGANNGSSLGAPDDHVHTYANMSVREYQHGAQGGWDNGECHNIYGDQYRMYYIPLTISVAGDRYNRSLAGESTDAGCGCIVI